MRRTCICILVLLLAAFCLICAAADGNVVYLSAGGSGSGESAAAPVGSLADAYAAIGGEGTVVVCGDFPISGKTAFPTHSGDVTITSVYDGVDYRTANDAAIRFTGTGTINLHGPTVMDQLNIEIDSAAKSGVVIAANWNDVTIGRDFAFVYNYANTALATYFTGGPNNDATVPTLGAGQSVNIEILGGDFLYFTPFSRSVQNLTHYGTANVVFGGSASVSGCYLGALANGTTGGTANCTLKDSAAVSTLYLAGNGGGMNGDVTLNVRDGASVGRFDRYGAALFPNGTKTVNVYGNSTTLPANLATYFDVVNNIAEETGDLDTVYLSAGGYGDGSTVETPVGTLTAAVAALGDDGGTVVLCSDLPIGAITNLPAHTGTVTITSVYNDIDYRTANEAALRFTASCRIVLGGPTVFDGLVFEIDQAANSGVVLAGNFHPLRIGYDVAVVHNYSVTTSKLYIIGGSNNDGAGNGLAAGQSSTVEVYSGDYMQLTAFSRGTANKAHYGTMHITVGGNARIFETYLGAVTTGATGGTAVFEAKDNATLTGLYLSGNAGGMNGDVTVTLRDSASVSSFGRYAADIHSGTKTINVYGEGTTHPASLETYFDVVNVYIPRDTVLLTGGIDASRMTAITANGCTVSAAATAVSGGVSVEYPARDDSFTLAVTVKDGGYTVYTYAVTKTAGQPSAVLTAVNAYAGDVIYVGAIDGNGLTPDSPVSSFAAAYGLLTGSGGTFVVCGEVTALPVAAPAHAGKLTVTSVYDGVDYRTSGAKISFPNSVKYTIGGETLFEKITFDITTTAVVAAAFHPLTFGSGIEVINDYSGADANGLYLVGGHNSDSNTLATYPEDTNITVRSGHIRCIIAFSRYSGARVHTGKATVTVEGNAYVRYIFGGANNDNAVSKDTLIKVREQAIVECIYTGGNAKTNLTTGQVEIDVTELTGGDIYEFDAMSITTSRGKVKVCYDPRTVPNGIVTMAKMALFDVLSPCDVAGAHTYGAAVASPFGGGLSIQTCTVCGAKRLVGEPPEKVADGVIFVAAGGFGSGESPYDPCGDLEDAFKALGDAGGTVVITNAYVLPQNIEWKISRTNFSFQEPVHTGQVLITSVYGDSDYRQSGAKLIFDGNMHYRLSGPTTFANLRFDTVGDPVTNLIAARYNKLVFGEGCEMLKTIADGYQLWVVGGYQYFRYPDLAGVRIDDRFIDVTSRYRPHDFDYAPEDLVDFTYLAGSGKEITVKLQADAAAAFSAMFDDMRAAGLYVPFASWPFRSGQTQYDIFADSVKQKRVKGVSFDEAYLSVSTSASPPGFSEHQLGFAFDIYDERLEATYGKGNAHVHYNETPEWAWIVANCSKYGIIHRFISTKRAQTGIVYEAWHFRYVGMEHAAAIAQTDYCLEEYVGELLGLFDRDASVTALSGDFYQIMGGSRGCDDLTFTGTRRVTVGEQATVVNLLDVDGEVIETPVDPGDDPTPAPVAGDATGDGRITLADALRALKYIADNTVELDAAAADTNGDGMVTLFDALTILMMVLNK